MVAPSSRHAALAAFCALAAPALASAQCATPWDAHGGLAGTDGIVNDTVAWDPDGPGPLGERLVLVGSFAQAGPLPTDDIAAFDPATGTWSAFGTGTDGFATTVAVLANGDLVVAGSFTSVDAVAAANLARWDGSAWQPFGAGLDGPVLALLELANGDLIAAGEFANAGGIAAARIARWDGAAWQTLGSGLDGDVHALASLANGDLVAAGEFSTAGSTAAAHVARWDGAQWHAFGTGTDGVVRALAVLGNGELVAGGPFTMAGGVAVPGMARWDGLGWVPFADPECVPIVFATTASGDLAMAGTTGLGEGLVAVWTGTEWQPLAGPDLLFGIASLAPFGLGLAAGGTFQAVAGVVTAGLAVWDGTEWQSPTRGLRPPVFGIAADASGTPLAVTGDDDEAWTRAMRRADGGGWRDLGLRELTLGGFWGDAYSVIELTDGSIVVGGAFQHESGSLGIARRTAAGVWEGLGGGMNGIVFALAELPNGDLVAGGSFTMAGGNPANRIARWDGTSWQPLDVGTDGPVHALVVEPGTGALFAGGAFAWAGSVPAGCVARWDGDWSAVGTGMDTAVYALCRLPGGDLVAGGPFVTADGAAAAHVARWNGTSWSACGTGTDGTVYALAALPNDDFVAGGQFTTAGGVSAANLARCSGATWSAFGSGADDAVIALATMPRGELFAGGYFTSVDGEPSARIARIATTCPADASVLGEGCSGSGAPKTLAAATLPWVDAVFHAAGTGFPALAFVVALSSVNAFDPPIALDSFLPQGAPGCEVLVAPDILELLVADAGAATSSLFLPSTPPLVGVVFYHQMIALEVDAQLTILEVTATNALALTAGAW